MRGGRLNEDGGSLDERCADRRSRLSPTTRPRLRRPQGVAPRNHPAQVFAMTATFREVAAYSGVDENLPSGGKGIVIPSGGSTLVILEDGRGLDVRSTVPSKVHVHEFTKKQERADAAK